MKDVGGEVLRACWKCAAVEVFERKVGIIEKTAMRHRRGVLTDDDVYSSIGSLPKCPPRKKTK